MSQDTATGWPYPEGTDRVMDGDDAIAALAHRLENRVGAGFASGFVTIDAPPALDTPVRQHVNLPAGLFTSPPNVVIGLFTTDPGRLWVGVEADPTRPVSKDGFWVIGTRGSGPLGDIRCFWLAHQPGP